MLAWLKLHRRLNPWVCSLVVVVACFALGNPVVYSQGTPAQGNADKATSITFVPGSSARLLSGDGKIELLFPVDLATEPLSISYGPKPLVTLVNGQLFKLFELRAQATSRENAEVKQFARPLTIVLHYDLQDVAGLSRDSLHLIHLGPDGRETWLKTEHDKLGQTLTASVDHFSIFGGQGNSAYSAPGEVMYFQRDLNSGAATAIVPIELPPAPGLYKPNIDLRYYSGSADEMKNKRDVASWVGMGWNLHTPRIQYVETTQKYYIEIDGVVNGEIIWDDTYSVYVTVPDQHLKILRPDTCRWEVWDRNGTYYEFANSRSRGTICYQIDLTKVQDVHGNKVKVEYVNDTYGFVPGTVRYSFPQYIRYGNDLGTENYHIVVAFNAVFDYIGVNGSGNFRNDNPAYDLTYGIYPPEVMDNRKLNSIEIKLDGIRARKYTFAYTTTAGQTQFDCWSNPYITAGLHRLDSITQVGADGVSTLPSTTFEYETRSIYFNDSTSGTCAGNPGNPTEIARLYLKKVNNGHGASVSYTYVEKPARPVDNTWTRHVVATRTVDPDLITETDGVPVTTTITYLTNPDYVGCPGCSSAREYEYRGFKQVRETAADGTYQDHFFYTTSCCVIVTHPILGSVQRYGDRLRGREYQTKWFNSSGQLLQETFDDWNYAWSTRSPSFSYRVRLENTTLLVGSKKVYSESTFDSYDNVTKELAHGDYDVIGDERTVFSAVTPNTTAWILNRPNFERTYTGNVAVDDRGSALRSERRFYYDGLGYQVAPTKGNLTRVEAYKDASSWVTTTFGYDTHGNRTSIMDPNSRTTTFTIDATYHTYVTQITHPTLAVGTFTELQGWDYVLGKKTSDTDVNAQATSYEYDTFGRPVKVVRPGDTSASPSERYTYLNWGIPGQQRVKVEVKTSEGNYLWSEEYFDGLGRIVQVRSPDDGGQHAFQGTVRHDNMGRVANRYVPWRLADTTSPVYQAPPAGTRSASLAYDALGRVSTETGPDGASTSYAWSPSSPALMVWERLITDPRGNKKRQFVDTWQRLAKVEELDGAAALYATTTYTYDVLGNLTQLVDAAGNTTTLSYDWLARKTQMTDPDLGTWSYVYDAIGNLTQQTDARNKRLSFVYDALDRMTEKRECIGAGTPPSCSITTILATYTYDSVAGGNAGKGRRTGMTDAPGSASWVYDSRGRVTSETKTIDGAGYTTGYAYDPADRLTTLTYPGGEAVTQGYNLRGLPNSLGGYVSSTSYNALGLPTIMALGNGFESRFGYWNLGGTHDNPADCQPTQATDCYGRLSQTQAYSTLNGTPWQHVYYTWDSGGNLTRRQDVVMQETEDFTYDFLDRLTGASNLYTESYAYNQIGNMTSKNGVTYTYGDTAHKHAATQAGATTYAYDANGNMTSRGGQTLSWNAENRLASITGGAPPGETYTYDGDGKRVKRAISGGETIVYVNKHYQKNLTTGAVTKYYYLGDRLVAVHDGTTLRYWHPDHLNSANYASDQQGRTAFYPYGSTRRSSGSTGTQRKFTGQYEDGSGLYYYNARYYDAGLGRFISPDPVVADVSNPRDFNRYSYVRNNPLKYVDSTGEFPLAIAAIVAIPVIRALIVAGVVTAVQIWWDVSNQSDQPHQKLEALWKELKELAGPGTASPDPNDPLRRIPGPVRSFDSFRAYKNALGSAGTNKEWHHIVPQTSANITRFGAQNIHNTNNVVALDRELHVEISRYYSSIRDFTSGNTVREWLGAQSLEEQFRFGLDILRRVLEGLPLP